MALTFLLATQPYKVLERLDMLVAIERKKITLTKPELIELSIDVFDIPAFMRKAGYGIYKL